MYNETIPPSSGHPALACLLGFFSEMNRWERGMLDESRELPRMFAGKTEDEVTTGIAELRKQARARLAAIFEKYCEAGVNARRVKDTLHFGGAEPDYNAEKEAVQSLVIKGKRVIIETQMTHQFQYRLRYELVEVNDGWKIMDNRKYYSERLGKWHRHDL